MGIGECASLLPPAVDLSFSAWLVDIAREHPGAKVHGFDISPAQYPHSGWLPKNIELSTLDVLHPVPERLRGQYDVVHVGLLVLVVQKDNPFLVLGNLLSLLGRSTDRPSTNSYNVAASDMDQIF